MNKLSFRARALDYNKQLPIYRLEELTEVDENSMISRAVKELPTGMEKEEEEEHHIQAAISSQQVYGAISQHTVIPTPEAEVSVANYEDLYTPGFRQPKQYIRIQDRVSEETPPEYDLDSEDDDWLINLNNNNLQSSEENPPEENSLFIGPQQLESFFDKFEAASIEGITIEEKEALSVVNFNPIILSQCYQYWLAKRRKLDGSVIPSFKKENKSNPQLSFNDPYVAFRRRTERMQTRKNRKNDELSFQRMLKLKREFSRGKSLFEMVKAREKLKRDIIFLSREMVETRFQEADFSTPLMFLLPPPPPPPRPIVSSISQSIGDDDLEDIHSFTMSKKLLALKTSKRKRKAQVAASLESSQLLHDAGEDHKGSLTSLISTSGNLFKPSKRKNKSSVLKYLKGGNSLAPGFDKVSKKPYIITDLDELQRFLNSCVDTPANSSTATKVPSSQKLPPPEDAIDDFYSFKPKKYLRYHAPLRKPRSCIPNQTHSTYRMFSLYGSSDQPFVFGRRRIGRGGRLLYDRATVVPKVTPAEIPSYEIFEYKPLQPAEKSCFISDPSHSSPPLIVVDEENTNPLHPKSQPKQLPSTPSSSLSLSSSHHPQPQTPHFPVHTTTTGDSCVEKKTLNDGSSQNPDSTVQNICSLQFFDPKNIAEFDEFDIFENHIITDSVLQFFSGSHSECL